MFGTSSASSDASRQTPVKRRREGRGLGPFSSGHLTIIVVTLVIVVAFPFAAFAVTGSNVFVTDAVSGTRAKVNSSGQMAIVVNGSVTATQTPPSLAYAKSLFFSYPGTQFLVLDPAYGEGIGHHVGARHRGCDGHKLQGIRRASRFPYVQLQRYW